MDYRRDIPLAITFLVGVLAVLDYYTTLESVTATFTVIKNWGVVLQAFALGLGAVNLFRAFNLRHGITFEKDAPSPRYGSVPVDGKYKGLSIAPVWDEMLQSYYRKMGWDEEGKPLPETLKALGLEHVIEDLSAI